MEEQKKVPISEWTPQERFEVGSAEIKKILEKYQLSIVPIMEMQDTKPRPKPALDLTTSPPIEILKA